MVNHESHDPQRTTGVPATDGERESDALFEEELSLRKIVRALWWYRLVIAAAVVAVAVVATVVSVWVYLRQPVERQSSVEFRLDFEGADKGEYPNGLEFSHAEIIGAPVLTQVYESNGLSRYCRYDHFRNGFFIRESNRELELLGYEYAARLADSKLTAPERARIEDEFRQRRDALRVPQYTLIFLAPTTGEPLPDVLLTKLLSDVLATWAEQAALRRGVLQYQISMLSANVMPQEFLGAEDYLIRLDILRGKINRILENLDMLAELPGAAVQRVGEAKLSIAEIRANLYDVLRYKAEPLIGLIRGTGVSTNPMLLTRYLENRLFQVRLEKEEAQRKVAMLQDSLSRYMTERGVSIGGTQQGAPGQGTGASMPSATLIPQFGESFIDRLLELATENSDVEYRQDLTNKIIEAGAVSVTLERDLAYYESLLEAVRRRSPAAGARSAEESAQAIEARLGELYAATLKAIEQGNAFYEQLSTHNLNPRTNLYTMAGPFSIRTERAVTARPLMMNSLLVIGLTLILVPLSCLVHNYLSQEGLLKRRERPVASRDPVAVEPLDRVAVRRETAAPIAD